MLPVPEVCSLGRGAARKLGVKETTVKRRIARVERQLGVRLCERNLGILTSTDSGQIVISRAERSPR